MDRADSTNYQGVSVIQNPHNEFDRTCYGISDSEPASNVPKFLHKVPDVEQLWDDTHKYNLHVNEFFKGSFMYKTSTHELVSKEKQAAVPVLGEQTVSEQKEPTPEKEIFLPLVDSHAQTALRRRIVLDKLNRAYPDLLGTLQLSIQDVSTELRILVHTFKWVF